MKKLVLLFTIIISIMICGCKDPEPEHVHTFSDKWSKNATHHWKAATCEHSDQVSEKAEHKFGNWTTTKEPSEEESGLKERVCSVCKYKQTSELAMLSHVHKFASEWSTDGLYHWKVATCEHSDEISEKAKHSFVDEVCSVCSLYTPEGFVLVSAGTFNMGSNSGQDNNKPVHEVTITKPFYMGKYEVTQAEYESVIGTNPSKYKGDENLPAAGEVQENRPVETVSWYDILVYCNKRSLAEDLTPCYSINGSVNPSDWGEIPTETDATWNSVVCDFSAEGYRVPTEAEWEYAARAGDSTVDKLTYSGTSDLDKLGDYAWYSDNSGGISHEVGKKLPNDFGLYDMSGNVFEFCWNWFTGTYEDSEGGSDPTGVKLGSTRIVRGGWSNSEDYCAVSRRNGYYPEKTNSSIGFRVARSCPNTTE